MSRTYLNVALEDIVLLRVGGKGDATYCKGGGPRGPRLNIHRAYMLGKERRLLIGNVASGFLNTKVA